MERLFPTFVLSEVVTRLTGPKRVNCICKYQQKRMGSRAWSELVPAVSPPHLPPLPTQKSTLYLFCSHCTFAASFFALLPLIGC